MDRAFGYSTTRHSLQSILGTSNSRQGVVCSDGVDRAVQLGDDLEGISREAVRREVGTIGSATADRFLTAHLQDCHRLQLSQVSEAGESSR